MLLASLTLCAWWASGGRPLKLRGAELQLILISIGLLGTLLMGASGALAALGDTLFPAQSLLEGLRQEFSTTSHFLLRLRILHPAIAISVGIYLIIAVGFINLRTQDGSARYIARILTLLIVIQLGAGFLNVLLLAPVWMQILHLLLADLVWISLIIFSASIFAVSGVVTTDNVPRGSSSYLTGSETA
jgi:heme A synthase